jgi:CBS domain containing-hemolysin-like protein
MSLFSSLLLIFLLVVISALFSCAEISLAASRKLRLEMLVKDGVADAERVLQLQAQPGNFFTVVQIGVNAVAILAGVVAEPALSPHVASAVSLFYQGPWLDSVSFWIAFLLVTCVFILFADLVPKRLAMIAPERVAVAIVRPMLFLVVLFKPLVWLFSTLTRGVFALFRLPQSRHDVVTSDEVYAMVAAGAQTGALLRHEHHLIENVFELDARHVPSAMTPRESIVYLLQDDDDARVREQIVAHPYSRFLVCNGDIDHVVGYIDTKDLLRRLMQGQGFSLFDKALIRAPLTIPDGLNLWEVLEQMKTAGEDFAVVVNEYALVVGVITLTDVTGMLMGNLLNLSAEEPQIVRRDENSWLMDGLTPLTDVMNALDLDKLPNPANYETLTGFIMHMLRKIPKKADFVVFSDYKFEVVDMDGHKINQLLVTRVKSEPTELAL